ncbi:MAG: DNA cytosine methyltransferase [Coleofasciculaceae cyanobacterium RL_1_1]|nr:DNA cytosine methyltransferase [Coleofasciculaceae cyanobacterium RL_1_1]
MICPNPRSQKSKQHHQPKTANPPPKINSSPLFDRDRETPTLNLPLQSSHTHRIISLFSGCGGMDLGFLGNFTFLGKHYPKLPFKIIWANEQNPRACDTYRHNFSHNIICQDIWDAIETLPTSADIVIGGFPCQDISINGKRHGIEGERSGLYRAMVSVVETVQPKIFVAENVKGLLMKHSVFSLKKVLEDFRKLGYQISYKLYNSASFGVPQTRDRVFIIGTKSGINFTHPTPILSPDEYITAHTALHDLEDRPEAPEINHIWSKANRSKEQGGRRLKADRAGYTIRAECHGNIHFHYKHSRRMSMREAARIQSFPDEFIFQSKLRETERQIGNAVPPVLAWHVAKAVAMSLENYG